jgi:hypothetical protein
MIGEYINKDECMKLLEPSKNLVDWKAMVHTPELAPETYNTCKICKPIFGSGYGPSPVQ